MNHLFITDMKGNIVNRQQNEISRFELDFRKGEVISGYPAYNLDVDENYTAKLFVVNSNDRSAANIEISSPDGSREFSWGGHLFGPGLSLPKLEGFKIRPFYIQAVKPRGNITLSYVSLIEEAMREENIKT